jgi:uncharacterized protein YukE
VPIDTTAEGDPNSIRAVATWLRTRFRPALHYCGSQVFGARTNAEGGWRGAASDGFQSAMAKGGRAIDTLYADGGTLAAALDDYADGLHTAQAGMARARRIARAAGLTVTGDTVHDPAPDAGQVKAFADARAEADLATGFHTRSTAYLRNVLNELSGHRYEYATDFTNGVGGHLIEIQRRTLSSQAAHLRTQAQLFEDNYLNSPGGSDAAKLNEQLRSDAAAGAEDATDADEGLLARVGARIPGIGLAIVAGGVGWDVAHGTSPMRAIVTNGAGAGAAMAVDAGVTVLLPESVLVAAPALAAFGPIAAGVVAGAMVSVGVGEAYHQLDRPGVGAAMREGLKLTGHDFIGGAESVWHGLTSVF